MPNLRPKSLCHQSRIGEIQSLSVWIWMSKGVEWLLGVLLWGQSTLKSLHKMTIVQKWVQPAIIRLYFILKPHYRCSSYSQSSFQAAMRMRTIRFILSQKKILARNSFGSSNSILWFPKFPNSSEFSNLHFFVITWSF